MIDLLLLEALARDATPGPWSTETWRIATDSNEVFVTGCKVAIAHLYKPTADANARFIAALSPEVVLELIEMARRATPAAEMAERVELERYK